MGAAEKLETIHFGELESPFSAKKYRTEYGYILNDPVNMIDITGESPLLAIGGAILGGGVVGAFSSGITTYLVTHNLNQAIASAKTGFFAGAAATATSLAAVVGGIPTAAAVALGAGIDALISFAQLPSNAPGDDDMLDVAKGYQAIKAQKNRCE